MKSVQVCVVRFVTLVVPRCPADAVVDLNPHVRFLRRDAQRGLMSAPAETTAA